MNEALIGIFDAIFEKVFGQPWFYLIMAFWMGVMAVRSRNDRTEAWRFEITGIFLLGIAAILWQLSNLSN